MDSTERESDTSYMGVSNQIRITVTPFPLLDRTDPEKGVYAYAYRVELENLSPLKVQLMNRHWRVYSGGRQIADVKGEGVIGEQPVLNPGGGFEYSSWTVVYDPVGSMKGSYTFRTEEGSFFDCDIPEFFLASVDESKLH